MSEHNAKAWQRHNSEEVKGFHARARLEKRRLTPKERRLCDALVECLDARRAYWQSEGRRAERDANIAALAKRALKGG